MTKPEGPQVPDVPELSVGVAELKGEVRGLRLAVEQFEPRVTRAERVSTRTAMAATIIAILVVAVGFVGYRGIRSDQEIAQTNQRVDGLCPILALVVGGYDPETRAAGPDRDEYIKSFVVMREAYSNLGCTTPFVPPRQSSS